MNPKHRLVLTGSHQMNAWNGMLRPSYSSVAFGKPAASKATVVVISTPLTGASLSIL